MRLYAHRGAAAELPENTLPSFERALEVGADALEMDVHLSADRVLVVSHDPTGERMAGVSRAIRDCPYSEIQSWNVCGEHSGRYQMPSFAEVLDAFPDVVINVDLKPRELGIVPVMLRLLAEHRARERVQLASFHLPILRAVRRCGHPGGTSMAQPEVVLALASPSIARRLPRFGENAQIPTRAEYLRQENLSPSSVRGRYWPSDRWMVRRLRRVAKRIDFWTVNDPDEARRLAELPIDGIMTDDPRRIAQALGKAPASL